MPHAQSAQADVCRVWYRAHVSHERGDGAQEASEERSRHTKHLTLFYSWLCLHMMFQSLRKMEIDFLIIMRA